MGSQRLPSQPTAADLGRAFDKPIMNDITQNVPDDEVLLRFGLREPLLCAARFSACRIGAFYFVAFVHFVTGARGSSLAMLGLAS